VIDILPWHRQPLDELLARREKLPHALLIHGQQGIGKVEFARAVAQSLLCESPDSGVACGQCPACGWFNQGNHPDYRELLPENMVEEDEADGEAVAETDAKEKKKSREIKIDQIRAISDFMTLSTHRDGFRVLLIHPAETMNLAAANALLKTLEEPPPRTAILLVTDQLARLLATIRSRCQRVQLPAPTHEVALAWLTAQAVNTGRGGAEAALAMAGGAPLDAVAFADGTYQSERTQFVSALADAELDYTACAQTFEKSDLNNVLTWLQTWVSDLILVNLAGAPRHHIDQQKALTAMARELDLPRLFRFESLLRQARRSIGHPLNARLLLEQLLISYRQAVKIPSAT
jgi:DNA polymerase III subunit delta'